jgi:hypothetical protein
MNVKHAKNYAHCTKEETVQLLQKGAMSRSTAESTVSNCGPKRSDMPYPRLVAGARSSVLTGCVATALGAMPASVAGGVGNGSMRFTR